MLGTPGNAQARQSRSVLNLTMKKSMSHRLHIMPVIMPVTSLSHKVPMVANHSTPQVPRSQQVLLERARLMAMSQADHGRVALALTSIIVGLRWRVMYVDVRGLSTGIDGRGRAANGQAKVG